MLGNGSSGPTPCYLSYVTFKNTIRSLALNGSVPRQIDHSVLPTMGGSMQKLFLSALRFFVLVDDNGAPSSQLTKLALASDSDWKDYIQVMLEEKYPGLLDGLADTSPKMLRDQFVKSFSTIGASLVEPAIRFLVSAARDAGIPVSPLLIQRKVRAPSAPRKRRTARTPKQNVIQEEPKYVDPLGADHSFRTALMKKFPDFDPSWGEAQQKSWFEAFKRLLEMKEESEQKNGPAN